jgi:hexokinase
MFINSTENPQINQLEKLVSGAYQGSLFIRYLQQAASQNLLTDTAFIEAISAAKNWPSADLDKFADPEKRMVSVLGLRIGKSEHDATFVAELLPYFFQRAATLVLISLLASQEILGGQPLTVNVTGSVYHRSELFRRAFDPLVATHPSITINFIPRIMNGVALAGLS